MVPLLVLLAGVFTDLKSRKVPNWLVLALALISIICTYYFSGFAGLKTGGISVLVALGCCLPLVMSRVLGAGDMKLLMAFAINVGPIAVFWVVVFSFFWGALLGIFQAIMQKDFKNLMLNTLQLLDRKNKIASLEEPNLPFKLHKVPYTVALLFGWLTHLSMTGFAGFWGGG